MKNLLKAAAILSAAVLIGAGCTASSNVQTNPASGGANVTVPSGSAGGSYNQ